MLYFIFFSIKGINKGGNSKSELFILHPDRLCALLMGYEKNNNLISKRGAQFEISHIWQVNRSFICHSVSMWVFLSTDIGESFW
jgi:hypothetical protein